MIQNAQWSRICFICPKLEPWLPLCMSFFHIVCPFSHIYLFFILCRTFCQTWRLSFKHYIHFSYEWRIFFIHSTIHSILCGKIFIQKIFNFFREALFKFKISFIQNNAVLFIQKKIIFLKSRVSNRAKWSPEQLQWSM